MVQEDLLMVQEDLLSGTYAARCDSKTDDVFSDACLEVEVVCCFSGKLLNTLASEDPSCTSPHKGGMSKTQNTCCAKQ